MSLILKFDLQHLLKYVIKIYLLQNLIAFLGKSKIILFGPSHICAIFLNNIIIEKLIEKHKNIS